MLGGPAGDDEANKQMANSQVKSSFIQFIVAVGLINIGTRRFFERSNSNLIDVSFSSICSRSGHG